MKLTEIQPTLPIPPTGNSSETQTTSSTISQTEDFTNNKPTTLNSTKAQIDLLEINKQIEKKFKPTISKLLATSSDLLRIEEINKHFKHSHPLAIYLADNTLSFIDFNNKYITSENIYGNRITDFITALEQGLSQLKSILNHLKETRRPLEEKLETIKIVIAETKDRNPLSWKINILNQRFFQEMINTFQKKFPELSSLFPKENNPADTESIITALEKQKIANNETLLPINQTITRIQQEKDTYFKLIQEMDNYKKFIKQSI